MRTAPSVQHNAIIAGEKANGVIQLKCCYSFHPSAMDMVRSFAIVGRPNVGKSTLFNRLLGAKRSIVHDTPGVTRDWQQHHCTIQGMSVTLYDTPGVDSVNQRILDPSIQVQGIFWVFDALTGMTPQDEQMVHRLRKANCPIVAIANKCESEKTHPFAVAETARMGLDKPVCISALHGHGMDDLYHVMGSFDPHPRTDTVPVRKDAVVVSIIGRPNAGKSTLVNRFLGYDRMKVHATAGTTTDSIVSSGMWNDTTIHVVDTAGMRKKSNVHNTLEHLACQESYRSLIFSHVTLIVIDASTGPLSRQDALLISKAHNEGRAIIVGLSKWDTVANPKEYLNHLPRSIGNYPVCPFSSVSGQGIDRLWDTVIRSYTEWNTRLSTGPLNRWLNDKVKRHPAPLLNGHRIKVKYMTQVKSRPPTFSVFGYRVTSLPDSYKNYLINGLVHDFSLTSPRLVLRDIKNPYDTGAPKKR